MKNEYYEKIVFGRSVFKATNGKSEKVSKILRVL